MNAKVITLNKTKFSYIVFDTGEIFSIKSNKFLKPRNVDGYLYVILYNNGSKYQISVHRLVALMFIPNDDPLKNEVNHKDGNKQNNQVSNLEWSTTKENIDHAYRTGLKIGVRGALSHFAKYDSRDIEKACKYMEDGKYSLYKISKITGVSYGMLYLIYRRSAWIDISSKYHIENCLQERQYYTRNQYIHVFQMLSEHRYKLHDISKETGVSISAIKNIIRKKNNPKYNDLYKIYDIFN